MKELFRFTLDREVEKEVTEDGPDNTKITRKVKAPEPVILIIKKPTRAEKEEAQLFYGDTFRELAAPYDKNGQPKPHLITRIQLSRQYNDSGGIYSDGQQKFIESLRTGTLDAANYFVKLTQEKAPLEDINRAKEIWSSLRRELVRVETDEESVFSNCAESRAMQRTILWFVLHLTYTEKDGKAAPFFAGQSYEERLQSYDALEDDESDFAGTLLRKLHLYAQMVYNSDKLKPEDFERVERELTETGE